VNSNRIRARTGIASIAAVAMASGLATLSLAGPVRAEIGTAIIDRQIGDCMDCTQVISFTNTSQYVELKLSSTSGQCSQSAVEIAFDGQSYATRFVGPGADGTYSTPLAPGAHTIGLTYKSVSGCVEGTTGFSGHLLLGEQKPVPIGKVHLMATVTGDVNVYDAINFPEGAAHFLGILEGGNGNQVERIGGEGGTCQMDHWCEVKGPAVPTGQGWIWGHLQF
jgi:hypothetical protein